MENDKPNSNELTKKSLLASNTLMFAGSKIVPLLIGFFLIPILIEGYGKESFGYLTLVWLLINYLGLLDFGLGSSLVKYLSDTKDINVFSAITWNGFCLIFGLGTLLSILLFLFGNVAVQLADTSEELSTLFKNTFSYLTFSIPIIVSSSVFKSVLISRQKFKVLSLIQSLNSILNYLIPFIVLFTSSQSIDTVILVLIILKVLVSLVLLFTILSSGLMVKPKLRLEFALIKKLAGFGGWVSVSNILGPFIAQLDRYFVGLNIQPNLVAYYTTPGEVLGKVSIIPHSISTVLYPAFSSIGSHTKKGKQLLIEATLFKVMFLFLSLSFLSFFSFELLSLWIDQEFATNAFFITSIFCCTMYIRNLAAIPVVVLNSQSKPQYAAILHLIEFVIYIQILRWATGYESLLIFALAQLLITTIDSTLLYLFTFKESKFTVKDVKSIVFPILIFLIILLLPLIDLSFYLNFTIWIISNLVLIYWFFRTDSGAKLWLYLTNKLSVSK